MDSGADTTQKIVIAVAIILGIVIVLTIGYSLYTKAKVAEGELASKIALDTSTKKTTEVAAVSLTNEAKNKNGVTYDGLVQRRSDQAATTTNLEIVNETTPVDVPKEEPEVVEEEVLDTEPVEPTPPTKPTLPADDDRPLTYEEIVRIRQLPVENSPSGNLQTALEAQSQGEYKARY
jgi:3D (Asp-Asp-Asp) domain-containing protein